MALKVHQQCDQAAAELWALPRTPAIRASLCEIYAPFARVMAGKRFRDCKRADVEFDDMEGECLLALVKCIDAYDPVKSNGATFSTYCAPRLYGSAVEVERSNDVCNHKVRTNDKELRARLAAGDETADRTKLVPFLRQMPEKIDRPQQSDDQSHGAEQLNAMLAAADPTVAGYLREGLETRRHKKGVDAGPDFEALAIRWSTSVEGAAAVFRACVEQLQVLQTAA
jgi:DNA-directed RNA polymerase specialized sigma subunit